MIAQMGDAGTLAPARKANARRFQFLRDFST